MRDRSQEERGAVLALLPTTFPYGRGEAFLETEVPYLARHFARIVIAPQRVSGRARPLPDNVVVNTDLAAPSRRFLRRAVRAAFAVRSSSHLVYEVRRGLRRTRRLRNLRKILAVTDLALRTEQWLGMMQARNELPVDPVVYSYWMGGTTLGAVRAKRWAPRLTAVTRAHGGDLYEEGIGRKFLPLKGEILAGVDRLFSVSGNGAEYLVGQWPVHADKVEVARLGVPDPGCDAGASSDGVCRIISCSFPLPVKRLELLIEGLRAYALREDTPAVSWTHIGGGPYLERIRSIAEDRLPAAVRTRFLGSLSNDDVRAFYRDQPVDVFVNTSASEGVSVAIMEAHSFGIPVIATGVGGTPEIVDNANGVLLSPDPDPAEIAQGIAAAMGRLPEKRVGAKESWRTRYRAQANYEAFAERLLAIRAGSR